jgi:hypothetical protein
LLFVTSALAAAMLAAPTSALAAPSDAPAGTQPATSTPTEATEGNATALWIAGAVFGGVTAVVYGIGIGYTVAYAHERDEHLSGCATDRYPDECRSRQGSYEDSSLAALGSFAAGGVGLGVTVALLAAASMEPGYLAQGGTARAPGSGAVTWWAPPGAVGLGAKGTF